MRRFEHLYTTMFLVVRRDLDMRVETKHGWTVRVYDVELVDRPGGDRPVHVEGLHIRKDGQPGAHRRTGSWQAPVEDARPGWWVGGAA